MNLKIPINRLNQAIGTHKSMMSFARDKQYRKEYEYIVDNPELHYLVKDLKPIIKPGSITEDYCLSKLQEHSDFTAFARAEPGLTQTIRCRFPHLLDILPKTINFHTDESLLAKAKDCKSILEMREKYPNEYEYILRRGLREKCDVFWTDTSSKIYWTKERCSEEALKYKKRSHFSKGSETAYKAARKNGWLDEICSHMTKRLIWTLESCKKVAKQYKYLHDFRINHSGCYGACFDHGWLDEVCAHLVKKDYPKKTFTYTECAELVRSCKSIKELRKKNGACYRVILEKKWNIKLFKKFKKTQQLNKTKIINVSKNCKSLNELRKKLPGVVSWAIRNNFKLNKLFPKPKKTWTLVEAKKIAKPYRIMSDFKASKNTCYNFCKKKNWLKHLYPKNFRPTWTFKECQILARKYNRRYHFLKNHMGAYQYSLKMGWLDSITKHMEKWSYTFEECQKAALKYTTPGDFQKYSRNIYAAAVRHGWREKICTHMVSGHRIWTKEKCHIEALKYTTKIAFKNNSKAYSPARLAGWLKDICKHMTPLKSSYTKKQCIRIASKFKTRWEFQVKSSRAYAAAFKNGWLEEICVHMPKFAKGDRHEENVAQPKVCKELKKWGLTVIQEVKISPRSRVDIVCENNKGDKILIEVKSDKKFHREISLKNQIKKYKQDGKKKYGNKYQGTYLVSNRYGISLSTLKNYLKLTNFIH